MRRWRKVLGNVVLTPIWSAISLSGKGILTGDFQRKSGPQMLSTCRVKRICLHQDRRTDEDLPRNSFSLLRDVHAKSAHGGALSMILRLTFFFEKSAPGIPVYPPLRIATERRNFFLNFFSLNSAVDSPLLPLALRQRQAFSSN